MATPSIAEPAASWPAMDSPKAPPASRKQAAATALSLLPTFVERLRWGGSTVQLRSSSK